jgi:hypothetical protein
MSGGAAREGDMPFAKSAALNGFAEFTVIVTCNDTGEVIGTYLYDKVEDAYAKRREIQNELYSKGCEWDYDVWVYRALESVQF